MSQPRQSFDTPAATRLEDVKSNLRRAFPLPNSGRFDDLLQALNSPDQKANG
jgi:hypothetical protein